VVKQLVKIIQHKTTFISSLKTTNIRIYITDSMVWSSYMTGAHDVIVKFINIIIIFLVDVFRMRWSYTFSEGDISQGLPERQDACNVMHRNIIKVMHQRVVSIIKLSLILDFNLICYHLFSWKTQQRIQRPSFPQLVSACTYILNIVITPGRYIHAATPLDFTSSTSNRLANTEVGSRCAARLPKQTFFKILMYFCSKWRKERQ
jgi:membrane protein YdbS with pleckstrin-like domain